MKLKHLSEVFFKSFFQTSWNCCVALSIKTQIELYIEINFIKNICRNKLHEFKLVNRQITKNKIITKVDS